jgi:hypothetical protein
MLQRVDHSTVSVAEYMICSFNKDESLKESLRLLEASIGCVEENIGHADELLLLRMARLAIREKILLMAYE